MADAEVGDDVLDGDPTTRRLENTVAELFGAEAALFFPSGTQANQTGVRVVTEPGTELVLEANAHIVHYEQAGAAALAGVQVRPVNTPDGTLTVESIRAALRPATPHVPVVSAIAVENTHNAAGGKVMSIVGWDQIVAFAEDIGLPLHLDGARIWNAAVALNEELARMVRGATTVSVCLSKGLGCPVGSCLLADRDLIDKATRVRRRLGGGMRQSGVLAAAGLYALKHNLDRLAVDHANARLLADRLAHHNCVLPLAPDSNIVMLDLVAPGLTADKILPKLAQAGVLLVPFGPKRLRAVTHLDVTTEQVERAADVIASVLDSEGGSACV